MKMEMFLFVLVVVVISSMIGIYIKLLSIGAKKSTIILTPFLPIIALIFNYGVLKSNANKDMTIFLKIKFVFNSWITGFKNLSLLTGLMCCIVVETNATLRNVLKLIPFILKDKDKCLKNNKIETKVLKVYKEICVV